MKVWIECYSCGCSSEAYRKNKLLGYCAVHGANRTALYPPYWSRAENDRRMKQLGIER